MRRRCDSSFIIFVINRNTFMNNDEPKRCEICGWTLAKSVDDGCVPGNCSYRPEPGTDEYERIQKRRKELILDAVFTPL